jgi:hypothetical protein
VPVVLVTLSATDTPRAKRAGGCRSSRSRRSSTRRSVWLGLLLRSVPVARLFAYLPRLSVPEVAASIYILVALSVPEWYHPYPKWCYPQYPTRSPINIKHRQWGTPRLAYWRVRACVLTGEPTIIHARPLMHERASSCMSACMSAQARMRACVRACVRACACVHE